MSRLIELRLQIVDEFRAPFFHLPVDGVGGRLPGQRGGDDGLLVTEVVGASNDAIGVFMGVLSRERGPAETSKSTGGPSLGNLSWWGIRVLYVLVCDI